MYVNNGKQGIDEGMGVEDKLSEQDMVNSPSHYNQGDIEVIDAIEAWGFGIGFCAGSAIKYLARFQHKGKTEKECLQDLDKAAWYIERLKRCYEKANHEK